MSDRLSKDWHHGLALALAVVACAPSGQPPDPGRVAPMPGVGPAPARSTDPEPAGPRYPGPCFTEYQSHNLTQRRTYEYDAQGRPTNRDFSGGNEDRTDTFTYDAKGRLSAMRTDNRGPNPYVQHERTHYDDEGRRIRVDKRNKGDAPQWRTVETYDDEGRITERRSITVATGRVTFRRRFVYEDGRLVREEVDNEGKKKFPLTIVYHYGPGGRPDRKWREWDDRPSPSEEESFTYDDAGRLIERSTDLKTTRFERDAAGNVTAIEHVVPRTGEATDRIVYDYGCWQGRPIPPDAPVLVPHATLVDVADVPSITL